VQEGVRPDHGLRPGLRAISPKQVRSGVVTATPLNSAMSPSSTTIRLLRVARSVKVPDPRGTAGSMGTVRSGGGVQTPNNHAAVSPVAAQ
jgi:hypothetical protein